jgi:hypothetical protein
VNYIFGFGLLLVAAAIVVLFAMFGELYARVGGGGAGAGSGYVRILPEIPAGHVPQAWPLELASVAAAELGVLLVLSTACSSCASVARELGTREETELGGFGVLVSTTDRERGEQFLASHRIGAVAHHVDVGGTWVSAEFAVHSSPTALVFRSGRLVSALAFTDLAGLRAAVLPVREPA